MENEVMTQVEVMPVYSNIMVLPYEENPYVKAATEEGFVYNTGSFENPDSGEMDKKDERIRAGRVIAVGPQCKYIQEGDDIFYDRMTVRPVPFQDAGFLILAEQNVICVINERLTERFKLANV